MEGKNTTLYTFEAPIDLLSHATFFKMKGIDYTEDHRISLGCLGDAALMQYLDDRPQIRNIILSLDNDRGGRTASQKLMQSLKEKGYSVFEEFPQNKDYNEDLVKSQKNLQIERII